VRVLVLGGTKFLGRAVVEAALARGDDVTIFTRGQTNPDLFPDVERLRGDRHSDLSALAGRDWDSVVDTSAYVPRVARASAELLSGQAEHYTLISSVSVYAGFAEGPTEDSPLATIDDPAVEEITGETYGPLKALCEQAVREAFDGPSLHVRAGLIVGPHDPTGRFTYWPHRIERGGDMLAPGSPDRRIQVIDVRDLAEWILRMAAAREGGTFNATGPETPLTIGELLETSRDVSAGAAEVTWVDDAFLLEREVGEWMELPLWIPSEPGLFEADVTRALRAGLTFRPLEDTVRATLDLAVTTSDAGLAPARERELLDEWRAR
jgi:2'-hydroxyisoflavone reductase